MNTPEEGRHNETTQTCCGKAWRKRWVLSLDLKDMIVGQDRTERGREFQRLGPYTENALSPYVLVRVGGTRRSPRVSERRRYAEQLESREMSSER